MIGEPEVDDLHVIDALFVTVAILLEHDHDVFRLEISVCDFEGVEVDGGFDDLADDEGRNVLAEPFAFGHEGEQVLAGNVFLDDVDVRLAADGLLVLDDLGMRDHLHDFTLVVEHGDGILR